jgi:hypothetical protein
MHPALMDLATGWAMGLIAGYQPGAPVGAGQLCARAGLPPPARRVLSPCPQRGHNRAPRPVAVFDITLADARGRGLHRNPGFTIRRLEGALAFPAPTCARAGV